MIDEAKALLESSKAKLLLASQVCPTLPVEEVPNMKEFRVEVRNSFRTLHIFSFRTLYNFSFRTLLAVAGIILQVLTDIINVIG